MLFVFLRTKNNIENTNQNILQKNIKFSIKNLHLQLSRSIFIRFNPGTSLCYSAS